MNAPQEWEFTNLLELLRLYAEKYCELTGHLMSVGLQSTLRDVSPKNLELSNALIETLIPRLEEMKRDCRDIGLEATEDAIDHALRRWDGYHDASVMSNLCVGIATTLENELRRKVCLMLPRSAQRMYTSPQTGWEEIARVFPDTQGDIEELNKCKAFGRDAAAVFHALLIVEHGLIDLGKFLRVKDPKQGWDATCRELERILQAGRKAAPRHIQRHFDFIELVNKDIQSMKMAWRNKVNHAAHRLVVIDSYLKPSVAVKILIACNGFMLLLATEGPRKKVRKK